MREFFFWVTIFACFCSLNNCEEDGESRQTYVIRYKDGEQTIPVTVVLDYKKQTEYVINMNPRSPAKSVTLYDFKQRTIAYKDLTNKECFLGRLNHETLSEESSALQDVKNPVEVRPKIRSLDSRKPALTPTEIRNIAGQKTAVFCRKMNTWLLTPEKVHDISKREADEYEERTFQYHGQQSSQYSHFERETRRRYRSRSQPNNFRRRSHKKEGEAKYENGRLVYSEPLPSLPYSNTQSLQDIHFNSGNHVNDVHQNQSNYRKSQNPFLKETSLQDDKENSRASAITEFPFSAPNVSQTSTYINTGTRFPFSGEIPIYSKNTLNAAHNLKSNKTLKIASSEHEFVADSFKNSRKSQGKPTSDSPQGINETLATTSVPTVLAPFGQTYPNVHSSLVHLLPLYKPLSQEFEFNQQTGTESNIDNPETSNKKNIESEDHPFPTAFSEPNKIYTHLPDLYSSPHDPEVSINVLEIPKVTKEFENIRDNESHIMFSQSEYEKNLHNSEKSYSFSPRKHSENSSYVQKTTSQVDPSEQKIVLSYHNRNNTSKEIQFRRNLNNARPGITTTESPVFASEYSADKTTPSSYIPSVHTAFQNSEDFQIFSNFAGKEENSKIPQHLVLTTVYPLTIEKHRADENHRSDIPSEDDNDKLLLSHVVSDKQKKIHDTVPNKTKNADVLPYKIKYQNALRDFKPDEIVIEIGNIPTHTPPPFTSAFHRRSFTTVTPTVKSLLSNDIKSDTNQRNEQFATTSLSIYPTTRHPRKRISDKLHRPVQNGSISHNQRSSLRHNRYQTPKAPPQIGRFIGVNHFNSIHGSNRHQFHHPSRLLPPSRDTVTNQLHMSPLNNLPPGVSVHPRHPQAPLADMVHSNRPPTIPFVSDNQAFLKPHHQRHHRKKEKHPNSCCRLRGQSGALQSCCRNGGPCCSRSRRRMQTSNTQCCSSSNLLGQVIPSKQIQPPVRTSKKSLPPIRTEKTHRSEMDNKDRCQKEKMCRTLYESTQQVMVCRNAHIEGC